MCLATVSFCNSTEATDRAKGSSAFIHLSFLIRAQLCGFPPPPPFYASKYSFPVRNIRGRSQTESGMVCVLVRRGSRVQWSRRAIQQSALPVSSVETWRINGGRKKKHSFNTCLTCDFWQIKSACTRQTPTYPAAAFCLPACLSDWLLERRCNHGRNLPLPDSRRTWIQPQSRSLRSQTQWCLGAPETLETGTQIAHRDAFPVCLMGAQNERSVHTREVRRQGVKTRRRESARAE